MQMQKSLPNLPERNLKMPAETEMRAKLGLLTDAERDVLLAPQEAEEPSLQELLNSLTYEDPKPDPPDEQPLQEGQRVMLGGIEYRVTSIQTNLLQLKPVRIRVKKRKRKKKNKR